MVTLPIDRADIEAVLRRHVLDVWYPRCIDRRRGGFLCDYDRRWRPCGPHDKLLEFQARQTNLAAEALLFYPDDERLVDAARHGLEYLSGPLWDTKHGGWYGLLDIDGAPQRGSTKHAHGMAYAISACAAVFEALADETALDLARRGFEWLDEHAHDHVHGAYFGFLTREGRLITAPLAGTWTAERDPIGTPLGWKDGNVNSDVLEALTRLYAVWPDQRVAERITELVELLTKRMTGSDGGLRYFARADCTPVDSSWRYGQILMTSYRLVTARTQLGEPVRGSDDARRLLDYVLAHGLDEARGGFFYANVDIPAAPAAHSKQWWVQAEALRALIETSRVYPDERSELSEALVTHWQYIRGNLIDDEHGGFYTEPLDTVPGWRTIVGLGRAPAAVTRKGSIWKFAAHEGLALLAGLR